MARQHRYTTSETVTQNVARAATIAYYPHRNGGFVEVIYEIGEETGGVFRLSETASKRVPFDALPGPLQVVFRDLNDKALQVGAGDLYPAGAIEDV